MLTSAARSSSRSARRRSPAAAPLEMLESRVLLSGITSYANPEVNFPYGATIDNQGNLWTTDSDNFGDNSLVKITKNADGSLNTTHYPATYLAVEILFDSANNHLIVSNSGGPLQEFDLDGNLVQTYNFASDAQDPATIAISPVDGSVWYATPFMNDGQSSSVGHINLTTGDISAIQFPKSNGFVTAVGVAPDGTAWVGTSVVWNQSDDGGVVIDSNSYLGHVTAAADGALSITTFDSPSPTGVIGDLSVAGDGSFWFTFGINDTTGVAPVTESLVHTTVSGNTLSFQQYAVPEGVANDDTNGLANPTLIALDSANNRVWYTENNLANGPASSFGYLDVSTGDFSRISVPDSDPSFGIAIRGADLWITNGTGFGTNFVYANLTNFTPPIVATSPDLNATPGQAINGPIVAFAADASDSYTATIDYGDGTIQDGTVQYLPDSGTFVVLGNHTYAAQGTYHTLVRITSANGNGATLNGEATIAPASLPLTSAGVDLSAQKGVALAANVSGVTNVVVAQFSGSPAAYTATINWGDNTSTVGTIVALGNNQYYVEIPAGSKTYAAAGSYNVSVLISDGVNSTTATSTATISAVAIVASQNLVLKPLLGPIVLGSTANFTADSTSTASWFKATINWGDGTTSTGLVVRTATGKYTVIGLHIYFKKGTYAVTTTILDTVDTEIALATASIKV